MALAGLLVTASCSMPEAMTQSGLSNAGLSPALSHCMAKRMVRRLSLLQLRRLAGLGKAGQSTTVAQFLFRVRSLKDPRILAVTTGAAAVCATGFAR